MKKLFFTILLLILFFGLLPVAKADQQLLIEYPKIGEVDINKEGTTLSQIIQYIYLFSLGIVGLTAFVSIIIGAVQYITSAGNDTKMGDAKDRITSALLGILILLASVLILRTINPDLINLEFSLPGSQTDNTDTTGNYKCLCCCIPECTPTNPINRIPAWGYSECKETTYAQAQSDCASACSTECVDWDPNHEENYKATPCQ